MLLAPVSDAIDAGLEDAAAPGAAAAGAVGGAAAAGGAGGGTGARGGGRAGGGHGHGVDLCLQRARAEAVRVALIGEARHGRKQALPRVDGLEFTLSLGYL